TSPQFIGCYGNKDAHTPHIDELAREGVRFISAFSTNTVCSPSRTALITGVSTFETGTGHHRSKIPLPAFMHGFPYYLRQAGYYTSNNHKTDYNLPAEKSFIEEAWNESSKDGGWWGRKPGQPFFAVFNFMDSHQSRTMTNPYPQYRENVLDQLPEPARIRENDFEMPPFFSDTDEMRRQFARVYNSISLTDYKIGKLLERLERDKLSDSTIIFFFSDHGEGIPRGKTNGIGLGYRIPFIIWVPPMYRKLSPWAASTVTPELISFRDLAPTLISLAGGPVPQYMKGRVLMGSRREKPADYIELSSDRSDNGIDMVRSITDGRYVYSRNYMPFMPEARYVNYMEQGEIKKAMRRDLARGRLNALQESLFAPRPAEYLFDIRRDVWETVNLGKDPKFQSVVRKMRKRLDREVMRSRDVMFLPEYELTRISAATIPYEYRLNDKDYPLKEIYEAASLSGFRDRTSGRRQSELLKSGNPIIRYWAITGLRSQTPETVGQFSQQVLEAVNDRYPPVSITAAAIAYDVLADTTAAEHLKKYAMHPDADLALMSIN
ncbi:MAG TPA: sulfatase, partial [Anseongella sp.]|nr:sulfatase [Anseongella sp.]